MLSCSARYSCCFHFVQNHLEELWCLFDIACQSQLLKSKREFSVKFGQAIVTAQDRHATDSEREVCRFLFNC